jgi:transcriptional regulator with XRE-family HTH domain
MEWRLGSGSRRPLRQWPEGLYLIRYNKPVAAWAILQEARRRANLTQQELAEVAGRPQSTISKIERGRRDPTLTTLRELVRAAGFDLRFQLVPRDEHDRQLMDAMLALSPEERLARLEEQAEAFADVAVSRGAR